MPGPPRKPTQLRIIEGNPGKRPLPTNEPVPPEGELLPPERWSTEDRVALEEWERIVPILNKMHLASTADRSALIGYCEQWSVYVQASRLVRTQGLMLEGQKGNQVRNPAVQIARDALQMVKAFCTEFGLTPSARGKISLPGADEGNMPGAGILSS